MISRWCQVAFQNYGDEFKVRPVSLRLFFFSICELLGQAWQISGQVALTRVKTEAFLGKFDKKEMGKKSVCQEVFLMRTMEFELCKKGSKK